MTTPDTDTSAAPAPSAPAAAGKTRRKSAPRPTHPLLQTLWELYPGLFGARFLPLKLGIFEEMRAAHPDRLPAEELKVALGLHTRSNRYLEAVASGLPRHDLAGQPVEPVAPEHVHHAILELYRRKSSTPQEPAARSRAVEQLVGAVERSGLGRDGYRERFGQHEASLPLLEDALAVVAQKSARQEALVRAFRASGKSIEDFAEMYGMEPQAVAALVLPG
ncbi:MAG: ProQ/FinO family protein [Ramlibacter sp.]